MQDKVESRVLLVPDLKSKFFFGIRKPYPKAYPRGSAVRLLRRVGRSTGTGGGRTRLCHRHSLSKTTDVVATRRRNDCRPSGGQAERRQRDQLHTAWIICSCPHYCVEPVARRLHRGLGNTWRSFWRVRGTVRTGACARFTMVAGWSGAGISWISG